MRARQGEPSRAQTFPSRGAAVPPRPCHTYRLGGRGRCHTAPPAESRRQQSGGGGTRLSTPACLEV